MTYTRTRANAMPAQQEATKLSKLMVPLIANHTFKPAFNIRNHAHYFQWSASHNIARDIRYNTTNELHMYLPVVHSNNPDVLPTHSLKLGSAIMPYWLTQPATRNLIAKSIAKPRVYRLCTLPSQLQKSQNQFHSSDLQLTKPPNGISLIRNPKF